MKIATIVGFLACLGTNVHAGEITRHPLPNNSTFPIARAVEVSADTPLILQVAGLAAEGMLVEIEVVLARPGSD